MINVFCIEILSLFTRLQLQRRILSPALLRLLLKIWPVLSCELTKLVDCVFS